MITFKLNLS